MPQPPRSRARINADFAATIIMRAADLVELAAGGQDVNPNAYEALQRARDEFLGTRRRKDDKSRTYGWSQLVCDLRQCLERQGVIEPDTWGSISQWSMTTDPRRVAQILREAAPIINNLVNGRTTTASAFELMDDKQRNEFLLMRKAVQFLSHHGLKVIIQWERENPSAPLDFRGTIDSIPWAFELKQLRLPDPEGSHRQVGHPSDRRSIEQQLEALAACLPKIDDDAQALQKAIDKAVGDASTPAKINALGGDRYCLVIHNHQFTYADAWRHITMPDLTAFDLVIILHQETLPPIAVWEVLHQPVIDRPLPSQSVDDVADIAEFKMSHHRTPDPELIRQAWEHIEGFEDLEAIEYEILNAFKPAANDECKPHE